jgi:hypothetical protein
MDKFKRGKSFSGTKRPRDSSYQVTRARSGLKRTYGAIGQPRAMVFTQLKPNQKSIK